MKWSEKATNEQVLERKGEKRILLNNILCRKANWTCLLHDDIEGHMAEVKRVGGIRTQFLDGT